MKEAALKARLMLRGRGGSLTKFQLPSDAVIGREASAAVSVPVEGVSRLHARILWDGKWYWLEDLKSTNGTFLNGQAIERERLRHLDVITLGKTVDLLFVLRAEEPQLVKRRGIVRAALVRQAPEAAPVEIPQGEVTLGRSTVCNVVVEDVVVSKMHARIERSLDRLGLHDLGSSNGTYVNKNRVQDAELKDGDLLSLGGSDPLRVVIEVGEVTSSSGAFAAAPHQPTAPEERPDFSPDWKTRFEWSTGELAQLAGLHERVAAEAAKSNPEAPTLVRPPTKAGAPAAPATIPPRPAPAAPASATMPPVAKPTPVASPSPPGKLAEPTEIPGSPTVQMSNPFTTAEPKAARVPPAPPKPAAPSATVPKVVAPAPAPAPRVASIRIAGGGAEHVVSQPGSYELGRSQDVPLRIQHPTISRRHAAIVLAEDRGAAVLTDLGGANGTLLNGTAISAPQRLKTGDVIRIGTVDLAVTVTLA